MNSTIKIFRFFQKKYCHASQNYLKKMLVFDKKSIKQLIFTILKNHREIIWNVLSSKTTLSQDYRSFHHVISDVHHVIILDFLIVTLVSQIQIPFTKYGHLLPYKDKTRFINIFYSFDIARTIVEKKIRKNVEINFRKNSSYVFPRLQPSSSIHKAEFLGPVHTTEVVLM